jgi:hypothetical protein
LFLEFPTFLVDKLLTWFCFYRQLNISIDKPSPGEECTITITTTPNAVVALSAFENRKTLEHLESEVLKTTKPTSNNLFFIHEDIDGECPDGNAVRVAADVKAVSKQEVQGNKRNEPWIFETFKANSDGIVSLKRVVPNTVTTWYISGLSLHHQLGLASSALKEVQVSKDFFIKVDLPSTTRFQEVTKIIVNVFNLQSEPTKVDVKIEGNEESEEFEMIEMTSDCIFIPVDGRNNSKTVSVEGNSQSSILFVIRPVKSGMLEMKLKASSDLKLEDEAFKQLKVLPDITTTHKTSSFFADLRNETEFSYGLSLNIPEEAIDRTVKIEGAAGNFLDSLVDDAKSMLAG